jgi:hypothetical protein
MAPYSQRIIPLSSATPRIRACMAAKVPSACQRCSQRCVALFDAHWGPRGTSHHRHPVIKTYNNVFNIFRNGACGIPRPRLDGAGGKTSSNKRHSKSLMPSNRPAILPSSIQIEQYSIKIILVGYIHIRFHGMQYREQEGTTNLRVKEEADFSVVLFRSNFMLFSEKNHIKVRRTQWLLAMPYPPICFTATDSARCSYRTPSGGTVNTFP